MKPNHHLDFVRIKLITEKRLYSEEELTSSQKVVQFISKELAECDREVLCILNCNAKCQVINMNVVSMGSLTETLVTGRELFKSAILSNARGVILIHNHPSGNFTPSKEDFLVTTKMCIGGDILGIDVWDHIIIAGGSWKELEKTGFVHQMEERGVRYVELPDLNQTDGLVQVAIYGEDQLKFQAWYDRFLMAEMKGGEHELQNLNHLTSGRTSIVSIPVEQKIDLLTDDFAVLQVNYSILPDLQVGDGEIQVVVANTDLAKVEHWYRMYQEQCLSEGKEIPDFQTMDMGKYRETGVMKEEAYVDTSSEAIQKAVRKYEGQEPGELEQKVLQQEQSIRSMNNEQYQEFHNNPEFIEITINHETLVQESQLASSWDMERRGMFASRIPGTWGDGEQTLVLPTEQVFRTDDGKTYIGFVERKEKQLILNADGSMVPSEKRSTGERLYAERYEPVSRKFGKKESQQKNTAEKEMIQTVIKQAPSKVPTIPKKGI